MAACTRSIEMGMHRAGGVGGRVNDGRNAGTVVDTAGVTRPCPSTPRADGCAHISARTQARSALLEALPSALQHGHEPHAIQSCAGEHGHADWGVPKSRREERALWLGNPQA